MARYQLLSRPECHLCHEMEALMDEVLPLHGETFTIEEVDSRPEWRERFGDVVPVLLRDGRPVAKVRLSRPRLERIVRAGARG